MGAGARERARGDLAALAHRGLGVRDYALAAAGTLGRVVGFDGVCILTFDPATLLPTGAVVERALPPSALPRMTEIEVGEPDVLKFTDLASGARPAGTLAQATGGVLERSLRQRDVRGPHGFGDELRAVLVTDSGTWGGITLLREAGSSDFDAGDVDAVAALSGLLAEGLRRALLLTALEAGAGDDEAGLLVLDDDDAIGLANDAALRWLEELDAGDGGPDRLPVVVRAVARRARAVAAGRGEGPARARVPTRTGRWLAVRGTMLGDAPDARAALIVERASPPELAPLIADAHGLTPRERLVTQLVAQGHGTAAIARRMHLAPYTVQDHLKAIFEKVDVRSRGELVARLFFDHYAPRLASGDPVAATGWFASGGQGPEG
jgi:DNA-binding CsgD family transcriptional regulator